MLLFYIAIGKTFGGEAWVFGGEASPPPPPVDWSLVLPVQVVVVQVPRLHRSAWGGDYVTVCYRSHTMTATSTHATQCPTSDLNTVSASSHLPPHTVTRVGICCLSHHTCYLLHDGLGWSDHRLSKLCVWDWNPPRLASIVTILQLAENIHGIKLFAEPLLNTKVSSCKKFSAYGRL